MRRGKVWIVVAVLLGVVLLAAAWAGWTAYRVNQDLSAAVDDVTVLRQAVEDGNDDDADVALAGLKDHSGAAAQRTGGALWSALERLPFYGDDARGVAVVSEVIDDLSESGIE